MTKEEIEAFERRFEGKNRAKSGQKPVRIIELGLVFPSIEACARYLKVSPGTVSRLLRTKTPYGDVQIEEVE